MHQNNNANYWKEKLNMIQHVEGGAYREIYRAPLVIPVAALTPAHKNDRNAMTSIYFLLEYGEFSAFHKIASDELWHFYAGNSLCIYEITQSGTLIKHLLGADISANESFMVAIPAGSWFASRVERPGGYTLCGCTVAPGFDFDDFELAERVQLIAQYPEHKHIIESLTRI